MHVKLPISYYVVSKIYAINGGLMLVTKQSYFGGTSSAHCLPAKSVRDSPPPQSHLNWKWYLDEVFMTINGETHYLWRTVDH